MIARVVAALVAVYLAVVAHPTRATCPPRWWLSRGVYPSGAYRCASPLPACCEDAKGECEHVSCPEPAHYDAAVYCTGGSHPIVVDSNTVGCTR